MTTEKLKEAIETATQKAGSLVAVSKQTKIPYRTLQDWKHGKRQPKTYSIPQILKILSSFSFAAKKTMEQSQRKRLDLK